MEQIYIGAMFFTVGICVGSFYNVLIYRLPRDMGFVRGRSFCPSCSHSLGAADLIPIISFAALGGKCRYCKEKISARYPLMECLVGLLFVLAYMRYGISLETAKYLILWSMLLIVGIIDLDNMFIMESVLFFFGVLLVIMAIACRDDIINSLLGAAAGLVMYYIIYFLAKRYYKKEAFGSGDVLLMLLIGFAVGLKHVLLAALMPFYLAGLYLIVRQLMKRRLSRNSEIPFGPFMCLSAWLISMYGQEIQDFLFRLVEF